MSVMLSKNGQVLVVTPDKRLDTVNSTEASVMISAEIKAGETKIVFNFAQTNYISSAGLRVILKAAKMLEKPNENLALCSANEQISEVLELSGFNMMVKCLNTLDEALSAVSE